MLWPISLVLIILKLLAASALLETIDIYLTRVRLHHVSDDRKGEDGAIYRALVSSYFGYQTVSIPHVPSLER
jgi:hypothetical protein